MFLHYNHKSKDDAYQYEWYSHEGEKYAVIADLNARLLALEEDAELRKKHPALQDLYNQYESMKALLNDRN